jgi:hypothetical protein
VEDLQQAKGYPPADIEQRAGDVSVDHPQVIPKYRTAHDIATKERHDAASTEELRQAFVCFRELFEELLEMQHYRTFFAFAVSAQGNARRRSPINPQLKSGESFRATFP